MYLQSILIFLNIQNCLFCAKWFISSMVVLEDFLKTLPSLLNPRNLLVFIQELIDTQTFVSSQKKNNSVTNHLFFLSLFLISLPKCRSSPCTALSLYFQTPTPTNVKEEKRPPPLNHQEAVSNHKKWLSQHQPTFRQQRTGTR